MSDYRCWAYEIFELSKEEYDYLLPVDFIRKNLFQRQGRYFWFGLPLDYINEIKSRLEFLHN
nr:MAG TPA: hypothetical protein [Caudoviricetes sp.]